MLVVKLVDIPVGLRADVAVAGLLLRLVVRVLGYVGHLLRDWLAVGALLLVFLEHLAHGVLE